MNNELEQLTRKINRLVAERDKTRDDYVRLEQRLTNKENELREALTERKELAARLSITPPKVKMRSRKASEEYRVKKAKALAHLQSLGSTWISPSNLSVLADISSAEVAEILRDAANSADTPVQHNGMRGKYSKYIWAEGPNKE